MRDIKFRAYDTEIEEMTYFNSDDYILQYGDVLRMFIDDYDDFGNPEYSYESVKDKVELMQYTGLKDKNGVEIYEGDIVGDKSIKWVVKWNTHRMGFSLYPTTEQIYDEMPVNVENKIHFEILGNIYDNPELLKEVK